MVGRRAAAAANDVDEAIAYEGLDLLRHELRALVIAAELVRQSGVRVGADEGVGDVREFGDVSAHGVGPKRAVEADGKGVGVAHRVPERRRRLAAQGAAGKVGDGARDHDRQLKAALFEDALCGKDAGLGVERIGNGLEQQQIGAAIDEPIDGLGVGCGDVVEAHCAVAGAVDVGGHGSGLVRRPECAGDIAPPSVPGLGQLRRFAGQSGAGDIQLIGEGLHAIIGHDNGGR